MTFLEVGFGGNLVQGFRVYAWRAVPNLLQIALWVPSFALWPQPFQWQSCGWFPHIDPHKTSAGVNVIKIQHPKWSMDPGTVAGSLIDPETAEKNCPPCFARLDKPDCTNSQILLYLRPSQYSKLCKSSCPYLFVLFKIDQVQKLCKKRVTHFILSLSSLNARKT